MKYRKKPVVVDAVQWFKRGDHPAVRPYGKYDRQCKECGVKDQLGKEPCHGWLSTVQGGSMICPGDWIIAESDRAGFYPCKLAIFRKTYEPVEE